MNITLRLLAIAVVMVAALSADAASIGLNVSSPGVTGTLDPNQSAGLISQFNWQNLNADNATGLILTDDSANATTATLTTTGGSLRPFNQTGPPSSVVGGDEVMNNVRLASFGSSMTFTVNLIPYAIYDLIVYVHAANGRSYSVQVGTTTLWGLSPDPNAPGYIDGDGAFTYNAAVGTSLGTATPNANYYRFNNLSNAAPLTFVMASGNDLPNTNGFQIVQVPEPGSVVLIVGGLCALGLRRRRGVRAREI